MDARFSAWQHLGKHSVLSPIPQRQGANSSNSSDPSTVSRRGKRKAQQFPVSAAPLIRAEVTRSRSAHPGPQTSSSQRSHCVLPERHTAQLTPCSAQRPQQTSVKLLHVQLRASVRSVLFLTGALSQKAKQGSKRDALERRN